MADTPLLASLKKSLPDHLTIESPLRNGGQGAVFTGTCNGAPAAIKLFFPSTERERVEREVRLLADIDCPHVVSLLDSRIIRADGQDIIVVAYEYHSGGDLMPHMDPKNQRLNEAELVRIGAEVSVGVETLWSKRIVHRDIKPGNVVVANDGRHVLVDLGLARHLDLTDITYPGFAPGTNGFRSPEHAAGRRNLTIAADVFSLGMTLFCLACQSHPLGGRDALASETIDCSVLCDNLGYSHGFASLISSLLSPKAFLRPPNPTDAFLALKG